MTAANNRFPGSEKSSTLRRPLRTVWFKLFLVFERMGVHILPKTCYSPIQDYRWLANNRSLWVARCRLTGLDWDIDEQFGWLGKICKPYYREIPGLEFYKESSARDWGPGYGPIESQVTHCFIRAVAPPQIIESGGGQSTMCMLHAAAMNAQDGRVVSQILSIDPYLRKELLQQQGITLLQQTCQSVPGEVFAKLRPGDLLVVDSSHAVKVGSDVIRVNLEIIPSLPPGVFIQIHDISLPYLYGPLTPSPSLMNNSQATALLAGLLIGNKSLSVLASLSALHHDKTQQLQMPLPDYRPQSSLEGLRQTEPPTGHFPGSIWMQTGQPRQCVAGPEEFATRRSERKYS
jgi:hypothetical protein